jgi:hypothetical protein
MSLERVQPSNRVIHPVKSIFTLPFVELYSHQGADEMKDDDQLPRRISQQRSLEVSNAVHQPFLGQGGRKCAYCISIFEQRDGPRIRWNAFSCMKRPHAGFHVLGSNKSFWVFRIYSDFSFKSRVYHPL